jgi:hypothetical protein
MPIDFQNITITGGLQLVSEGAAPPSGDQYWANVSFLSETVSTNGQTNSTFLDGSTIGATVNRTGTTTQGSYSPYPANSTTSYSAAVNGGSSYYNGASYLGTPSNAEYAFGTGDFTVEAWVNFGSIASAISPICQSDAVGSSSSDKWWFGYTAGALYFACHQGGQPFASIPFTPTLNTWYNLAVTRSSGTMRLFVDGVSGTVTNGNGGLSGVNLSQNGMSVGAMSSPFYLTGYLSDVRLVKGTALYTATYSVPTAPLTAVSGTSLLLNFTNAGMYDAAAKNNMLSTGTAQASTTQAKWSPTSAFFNGSSSLSTLTNTEFGYGTGDFTIEFWLYLNAVGTQTIVSNLTSASGTQPYIYYDSVLGLVYFTASAARITGSTLNTGTWYYITVCRASGSTKMFINGTQTGSTYTDNNNYGSSNPLSLGDYFNTYPTLHGSSRLNGYIQDLRVTKGVARYTSNFSVPTAALPTSA